MLAVPAMAEPNPATDSAAPSASQPDSPSAPDAAQAEDQAPDAADSNTAAPEQSDPDAGQAAIEAPKSSILVNIDKSIQEMTAVK